MSCFAASSRPTEFQRAYCMSPSVWWNYGEMTSIVLNNGKLLGKPKSIVVEVGTAEDAYVNSFLSLSLPPTYWSELIGDMVNSWVQIGMGLVDEPANKQQGLQLESDSNLYYFFHTGGLHSGTSWVDAFSYGLTLMYQYQFPDYFQNQKNKNMVYQYPTNECACDDSTDVSTKNIVIVVLAVFSGIFFLSFITMTYLYLTLKKVASVSLISKIQVSDKL